MSNITLSIDEETIKQAKLRAVQEGTSLSAKMRELLQRYASGQSDETGPDLSFAENARHFARMRQGAAAPDPAVPPDVSSQPPASERVRVDPATLRQMRGWAREDAYDHPTRHGDAPPRAP